MLTREQKEHRVCVCQDLLNQYEAEGDSLLGRIITGDETCCTAEVRGSKGIPPAAPRPPAVGARRTSRRKRSSRPTGGAAASGGIWKERLTKAAGLKEPLALLGPFCCLSPTAFFQCVFKPAQQPRGGLKVWRH